MECGWTTSSSGMVEANHERRGCFPLSRTCGEKVGGEGQQHAPNKTLPLTLTLSRHGEAVLRTDAG